MHYFVNYLKTLNTKWKGLLRKLALILITAVSMVIFFFVFPYIWPFFVAYVFSRVLLPVVALISNNNYRFKIKRNLATWICILLFYSIIGLLLTILVNCIVSELITLGQNIPTFITWFTETGYPLLKERIIELMKVFPINADELINNSLQNIETQIVAMLASLSKIITSGAWNITTSIPYVLLSIVLTVMSTFYLTNDQTKITAFFVRNFPETMLEKANVIKKQLYKALFGQIKSQLTVSTIATVLLIISFSLYNIPYALILGLVIGISDALPIVGAGLYLIPMSIIYFIMGDIATGIFMFLMYIGVIIIRQICEPKIVGINLGLYPLATMIAMFVGFSSIGFLGMLLGPVMLNLISVIIKIDSHSKLENNSAKKIKGHL